MRVFGEKDMGGLAEGGGSVERDERIVEFETMLRKEGGGRASNAEYKAAAEEPSEEKRGEWKRDELVERVHREPRAPSQRPDLLLSIQTAYDLPPWIICKYIYFDFVHNMILFRRVSRVCRALLFYLARFTLFNRIFFVN